MKLVRFGPTGREKPGVLVDGVRRDVSSIVRDYDREFFEGGGLDRLRAALAGDLSGFPPVETAERFGACVARPGKVVGIGLNYRAHARESGLELPPEPILFLKAPSTVVGPYDDVILPRGSRKTDWEVELGVVIGEPARYLTSVEGALAHVAGYAVSHDISEREFQLERGGQWMKGKSSDGFNPLGPYLATPEELGDVQALELTLDVNGSRCQTGSTADMLFGVAALVHYVSQFMSLEGGDLITTGTPPGVGLGMKPPRYLRPGDVCELSVTGLGRQRQTFREA